MIGIVALVVGAVALVIGMSFFNRLNTRRSIEAKGLKVLNDLPYWLPFIGHLWVVLTETDDDKLNPLPRTKKFLELYGGDSNTYAVEVMGRTYVLTTNPAIIRHITSTKFEEVYEKGEQQIKQYQEFFGNGIFNVNGDEWRELRKSASHLFLLNSLRSYVSIFHRNAEALFEKMLTIKAEDPYYATQGFDAQELFMRYTLDSFAEIGFGVELQSIQQEKNHFAIAFDYVQTFAEHRGKKGKLWKVIEWLSPNPTYYQHLNYMNETVYNIINERRKEPVENLKDRTDVLSYLLYELRDKPYTETTQAYLRDYVMNFLIAGRYAISFMLSYTHLTSDTTAILLTFCFYLLAKHPDVEQKVLQEIEEKLGDAEVNWDNIKSCTYIKWVLQETLRMYPPVWADGYACKQDDVLPGDYFIPKGAEVYYISALMHRRPDLYPDPDEFIPERWAKELDDKYAYVPFHAGPRVCLGKEMAYEEAKIMVINLLRKYKLRLVEGFEPINKIAILQTSGNGMRMKLDPR